MRNYIYDANFTGNGFFNESDGFWEKATRDRLIVMDDFSGLADESK